MMDVNERRDAFHTVAMTDLSASRKAARGTRPVFPPEWGDPVGQHWSTVCDDKETVHDEEPDGPHLTVWRWRDFEVTATFDIPSTSTDFNGGFTTTWDPVTPRGTGWKEVGPTNNRSTLWLRPRGKAVALRKRGQRNG